MKYFFYIENLLFLFLAAFAFFRGVSSKMVCFKNSFDSVAITAVKRIASMGFKIAFIMLKII